jgi:hypothetical protein
VATEGDVGLSAQDPLRVNLDPLYEGMTMRLLSGQAAALLMGAGLFMGTMAGATPAGAATLPFLSTTTTVSVSPAAGIPTSATATVSLELVNGLLITPSGSVTFVESNDGRIVPLGSAPLSKCLLGLPSLLGITQATCSATVSLTGYGFCYIGTVTASYSGATDLIAKPSVGSDAVNETACT